MDKLISTNQPSTKVAWGFPRSPDVPQNNDPRFTMQGAAPEGVNPPPAPWQETSSSPNYFRQMLPPAPRAQDLTEPNQTRRFSKFKQNRYQRNNLYALTSDNQNIMSVIDGGPSNANWVRGNHFGVNFNYKNIWGRPKMTIDQLPEEPTTLANVVPSPFYPFPTFFDRNDRLYKTYPDQRSSFFSFLPFYTFPYRTANNKDRIPEEENLQTKPDLVIPRTNTVEGFANQLTSPKTFGSILVVVLLLALFFLVASKRRFL